MAHQLFKFLQEVANVDLQNDYINELLDSLFSNEYHFFLYNWVHGSFKFISVTYMPDFLVMN